MKRFLNWFKGLKIIPKIIVSFLTVFILLLIIGFIGLALETDEEKAEREERIEQREEERERQKEEGRLAKEKEKQEKEEKKKDQEELQSDKASVGKSENEYVDNDENESIEDNENENEDLTWDDLKNKDKIIGNSNKDFKELTKSKPGKVRNDTTGNWRKITISENANIEDYALSYKELYMEESEVHFIINFNYNTTTQLNDLGGLLYVDIHEYEDKEEHDAKTIGSGMLLKSYIIYPDGDIEEME